MDGAQAGVVKRKRASRACDRCHRLGERCVPTETPSCRSCVEHRVACRDDRPKGRRGAPRKRPLDEPGPCSANEQVHTDILTPDIVSNLVYIYRVTVFPIYCHFHWPSFLEKIHDRLYDRAADFRTTVLAVCAVAAARLRDGASATFLADRDMTWLSSTPGPHMLAEKLREAATRRISAIPWDAIPSFDQLRTTALLGVLAIQDGRLHHLQAFLGRYCSMSTLMGFNDERSWPPDLGEHEIQERRCVYWSCFTLDVFVAQVWHSNIRHRASQSFVAYPDWRMERSAARQSTSWLRGWNVVTDLYRILEDVITVQGDSKSLRTNTSRPPDLPQSVQRLPISSEQLNSALDTVLQSLEPDFALHSLTSAEITGNPGEDIYQFQMANIRVTAQAVKMALAATQEKSLQRCCAIASELLDVLSRIPAACMRAISAPFCFQLAAAGSLLGELVKGPLDFSSYIYVRELLRAFADVLEMLEVQLSGSRGSSARFKDQIERIDTFFRDSSNEPPNGPHAVRTQLQKNGGRSGTAGASRCLNELDTERREEPAYALEAAQGRDQMRISLPEELIDFWPFGETPQEAFDALFRSMEPVQTEF